VLVAQGDSAGALAAFRRGLAIAEALAARDRANTQWQRDLPISHDRIGDVLVAQGDGAGALAVSAEPRDCGGAGRTRPGQPAVAAGLDRVSCEA